MPVDTSRSPSLTDLNQTRSEESSIDYLLAETDQTTKESSIDGIRAK